MSESSGQRSRALGLGARHPPRKGANSAKLKTGSQHYSGRNIIPLPCVKIAITTMASAISAETKDSRISPPLKASPLDLQRGLVLAQSRPALIPFASEDSVEVMVIQIDHMLQQMERQVCCRGGGVS